MKHGRGPIESWLDARLKAQRQAKTPAGHDAIVGEWACVHRGPDAAEVDRFCYAMEALMRARDQR
jgi:hypothetical protein